MIQHINKPCENYQTYNIKFISVRVKYLLRSKQILNSSERTYFVQSIENEIFHLPCNLVIIYHNIWHDRQNLNWNSHFWRKYCKLSIKRKNFSTVLIPPFFINTCSIVFLNTFFNVWKAEEKQNILVNNINGIPRVCERAL